MSSSRRRKEGPSGEAGKKKAKVASTAEEARFWTSLEETPDNPPGDGLNNQWIAFHEKLSKSLPKPARQAMLCCVCATTYSIQTKRDVFCFNEHVPQRNYTDATAHLLLIRKKNLNNTSRATQFRFERFHLWRACILLGEKIC